MVDFQASNDTRLAPCMTLQTARGARAPLGRGGGASPVSMVRVARVDGGSPSRGQGRRNCQRGSGVEALPPIWPDSSRMSTSTTYHHECVSRWWRRRSMRRRHYRLVPMVVCDKARTDPYATAEQYYGPVLSSLEPLSKAAGPLLRGVGGAAMCDRVDAGTIRFDPDQQPNKRQIERTFAAVSTRHRHGKQARVRSSKCQRGPLL